VKSPRKRAFSFVGFEREVRFGSFSRSGCGSVQTLVDPVRMFQVRGEGIDPDAEDLR
jgi:hypothetical protein